MVAFPPCKINLGLQVVGKRQDGYHDIITCFYPVPRTDILEVIPSDRFSFTQTGIPVPGDGEDNIVVKAYRLLQNDPGIAPVQIHLHKLIPTGAGLGGGSSDAAYTLLLLNQVLNLNLPAEKLHQYAAQLGSDCAFFIEGKPRLGTGRGEVLTPVQVNLEKKFIVIVKPVVHISTAEAYRNITPRIPDYDLKEILEGYPVSAWKDRIGNDFEEGIFRRNPQIAKIKETFYSKGALYASMSGSGAAVYGIFSEETDLRHLFVDADYWSGYL